jgi:hypothetical protein
MVHRRAKRSRGAEYHEPRELRGEDLPRRKRGAQPGNLNALKHGFYAKHFRSDELAELAQATTASLNGEIGLTRVAARRVLALLDEAERADDPVGSKVALLNAISMAALRVASLLKTKKYLSGNGDDMGAALQEALKDVAEETEGKG